MKGFCVKERVCICAFSSPSLCGKQLVVVGGALVVILSVSDDCGQAFTDQSLRYVTGGKRGEREKERKREITFKKKPTRKNPSASHRILSKLAQQKNKDMTNPRGGFAKEQRSLKC